MTFPCAPDLRPPPETPSTCVRPQAGNALCQVRTRNNREQGYLGSQPQPHAPSPGPPRGRNRISGEHVGPIPPLVPGLIALPTWKQQLPGASLECSTPGGSLQVGRRKCRWQEPKRVFTTRPSSRFPRPRARTPGLGEDVPGRVHKPGSATAPAGCSIRAGVAGAAGARTQVRALRWQPHPSVRNSSPLASSLWSATRDSSYPPPRCSL